MKNFALLLFLVNAFFGFSQNKNVQSKTKQNKKQGYYAISKVTPDMNMESDATKLIFTFIGPTDQPARSHVKIVCNGDSAYPTIDATGTYSVELDPGKYKMRFEVPYWYSVITDSILCKRQTATNIMVRFEAKVLK